MAKKSMKKGNKKDVDSRKSKNLFYVVGAGIVIALLLAVMVYFSDYGYAGKATAVYEKVEGKDVLPVTITFAQDEKDATFKHKDTDYKVSFSGVVKGILEELKVVEVASGCNGDADCKEGYGCTADTCVKLQMSCDGDADCPEFYICEGGDAAKEGYQGACTPLVVPCDEANPCEEGKMCADSQCVPAATGCNVDADCAEGESCISNECVTTPTFCGNNVCEQKETPSNCAEDCYMDLMINKDATNSDDAIIHAGYLNEFGYLCVENIGTIRYIGTLEVKLATMDSKDWAAAKENDMVYFTTPELTFEAGGGCVDVNPYFGSVEYDANLFNTEAIIPVAILIDPNNAITEKAEDNNGYRTWITNIENPN